MPNPLYNGVEEWARGDTITFAGLAKASSIKQTIYKPTLQELQFTNRMFLLNGERAWVTADTNATLNGEYVFLGKTSSPTSGLWYRVYGANPGGTTADRTAAIPNPYQGQQWYNTTFGYTEAYYEAYSVNNLGGALAAGWYYHSGSQPTINRRQTSLVTLAAGSAGGMIPYATDVESGIPGLDYNGGHFIASRPMRIEFDLAINFSGGGTGGTYGNSFIRLSTRSALTTYTDIYKYGIRVDSSANTNPVRSGEFSLRTDQAVSVRANIFSGGSVTPVDDGARTSTYIFIRELPAPPRIATL